MLIYSTKIMIIYLVLYIPHAIMFFFFSQKMQFLREKRFKQTIRQVKVENEEITYETATTAMRRAAHFFSAMQASDGHWPGENAGPLFLLPPLVSPLILKIVRRMGKCNKK